jgi:hypothetical protein
MVIEFIKGKRMGGRVCPVGWNKSSCGAESMVFAKILPDERKFLIRLDEPPEPTNFSKIKYIVTGHGLEVAEVARVEKRTVNVITPDTVIIVSRHIAIGRYVIG